MNLFTVDTRAQALNKLMEAFPERAPAAMVPLAQACGKILAEDLNAPEDIPAFRRSMVDGYAVMAKDTYGGGESSPILLRNLGKVDMGKPCDISLASGGLIYVPTGGEIPEGADAMVMLEYTEPFGEDIAVLTTAAVKEHVVGIGEDVTKGSLILEKGTQIEAKHLGLLATLGFSKLKVARTLTVAVLSTGDELIDPDQPLTPGKIRDSNQYTLTALAAAFGAEVTLAKRVKDDPKSLESALKEAIETADVVLLSGGSSVGAMDYTAEVIDSLGQPGLLTHGLAIKPGKPTMSAKVEQTAIFGLPGHPSACYIAFLALVAPFISYMQGSEAPLFTEVSCKANFQLHAASGRDVYQMVKLRKTADGLVADALHGKSGMVSQMSSADGFVVVPMATEGIRIGDPLWAFILK